MGKSNILIVRKPQEAINHKTTIAIYIKQHAHIHIKLAMIYWHHDGRTTVRGAFNIMYLFIIYLFATYVDCCYASRAFLSYDDIF